MRFEDVHFHVGIEQRPQIIEQIAAHPPARQHAELIGDDPLHGREERQFLADRPLLDKTMRDRFDHAEITLHRFAEVTTLLDFTLMPVRYTIQRNQEGIRTHFARQTAEQRLTRKILLAFLREEAIRQRPAMTTIGRPSSVIWKMGPSS